LTALKTKNYKKNMYIFTFCTFRKDSPGPRTPSPAAVGGHPGAGGRNAPGWRQPAEEETIFGGLLEINEIFTSQNLTSDTCQRSQGVGLAINDWLNFWHSHLHSRARAGQTKPSWKKLRATTATRNNSNSNRALKHTNKLWQSCGNLIKIK